MKPLGQQTDAELLTQDLDADRTTAIPGPMLPVRLGVAKWLDDDGCERLAYLHKFFKRDEHGQPIPESVVAFYVRDYMRRDGHPDLDALKLIGQRMGWIPCR